MPRFFFDFREAGEIAADTEGTVLPDVSAAQMEATDTLTQIARDVLPGSTSRELAVEVRDEDGRRLMRLCLTFIAELDPGH